MENKKLNRIGKKELLETLLAQTKRIEELEKEIDKLNKKLESRKILIEEAGSIADASLALNKIFENAQKTADDYLYNINEKCKKMETKTKKECQKLKEEAEKTLKEAMLEKEKNIIKTTKKSTKKPKKTAKTEKEKSSK